MARHGAIVPFATGFYAWRKVQDYFSWALTIICTLHKYQFKLRSLVFCPETHWHERTQTWLSTFWSKRVEASLCVGEFPKCLKHPAKNRCLWLVYVFCGFDAALDLKNLKPKTCFSLLTPLFLLQNRRKQLNTNVKRFPNKTGNGINFDQNGTTV